MKETFFICLCYCTLAFLLALALTPLLRKLAFRFNVLDRGDKGRKIHVGAIPRLGGVAIFISFAIPLFFSLYQNHWGDFNRQMVLTLAACFFVFVIGFRDDVKGASIIGRLLVEFAAAFLVYLAGVRIEFITNPFGAPLALGWLSLPVTLLWMVVITNAFNFIDGLDGLATGTGIMVILSMMLLNWGNPDQYLALTLFTLLGALLGFLVYNFPPASIFMGDSGSLFLGFFLASFSIATSHKATAAAAMLVPLFAFSVPLLDMIYAILRRWHRGLPLGRADREHIHHMLLEKGITRKKAVLFFYAAYFVILLAILIFIKSKVDLSLLYLSFMFAAAVVGLRLLGYIRYSDFFKQNYHQFVIAHRRRYYCYLIKRFQTAINKMDRWPDFNFHLDKLFGDYDFAKVQIELCFADGLHPVYYFTTEKNETNMLLLEFPLRQGRIFRGWVIIHKKMANENFLCISELTYALSVSLCDFVFGHPDLKSIDWSLKNEDDGQFFNAGERTKTTEVIESKSDVYAAVN